MVPRFHFLSCARPRRLRTLPSQQYDGLRIDPSVRRRLMLYGLAIMLLILVALLRSANAGGPKYVAGTSYFNAGIAGQPVLWQNGVLTYYTDQGNLSPLLSGPGADAFVADAFTRWTSVSTTALSVIHGGQLAEDVSGANVVRNLDGSITMPADIQPSGTSTPVGVVYDYDGQVIDALLGANSGDADSCFSNAVIGGPDAFTVDGYIVHALVVLNGNCLQVSSDLLESKYRLVRVLGTVLGLDWSQLNLNVITGVPRHPTADDQAGFPVMHAIDPQGCVPITLCYPDPDHLKMDDRAAIARLYPVTSANAGQFPGKSIFAATTGRIHGSVRFTDASGNPAQPMQAVNVVARWIDPNTGAPSGRWAASAVSGALFRGNAGNPITGFLDPTGQRYDRFGSADPAWEGFFDLAGLEIPQGSSAQYQLTVEALDPNWSQLVGPYAPDQVLPSGKSAAVTVTLGPGSDVPQDMLMSASAVDLADPNRNESYDAPQAVPSKGEWKGALTGYGDSDFFWLTAQANRTMSIDVRALNEAGQASELKARPVIGIWALADPEGTPPPAYTFSPFNIGTLGLTRLNVQILNPAPFRIGIADFRGDGRPDFRYLAHVVYGDSVSPVRTSVSGNAPLILQGIGFKPGMTVTIGGANAPLMFVSATEMLASAPSLPDGKQSITITDPASGATSVLQQALTFGAASTDLITISQNNPAIPLGAQTPNPLRATVIASDGSPVNGATLQWNSTNGASFSACGGGPACAVLTDESGHAETRVTLNAAGATLVTATLAATGQQAPTTLSTTSAAKSLSLFPMRTWGTAGATLDVPLTARLLAANGTPIGGQKLNFYVTNGAGTVNPPSATTDSNGYARSTLHVGSLAGEVDAVVCVDGGGVTCPGFSLFVVQPWALQLQPVAGSQQAIIIGQAFLPLAVRVVDSSSPPNPVLGVPVLFETMMYRLDAGSPPAGPGGGDAGGSHNASGVLLGSAQNLVVSDADGYAAIVPSNGGGNRAMEVCISVTAGTSAVLNFEFEQLWPVAQPVSSR